MMAVSVWRIWRVRKEKEVRAALGYFAAQFLLNVLWTPAFFGLRNPALGLCMITVLWVLIGLTIQSFSKLEKPAALLLWPYWGWVTYATYLNAALWWLNR
jgi:tryptophan-rich sensory protein